MQFNCNFCSAVISPGKGGKFIAGWPPPGFSLVDLVFHVKNHNQETTKHRQDYFPMEDDRETANYF